MYRPASNVYGFSAFSFSLRDILVWLCNAGLVTLRRTFWKRERETEKRWFGCMRDRERQTAERFDREALYTAWGLWCVELLVVVWRWWSFNSWKLFVVYIPGWMEAHIANVYMLESCWKERKEKLTVLSVLLLLLAVLLSSYSVMLMCQWLLAAY